MKIHVFTIVAGSLLVLPAAHAQKDAQVRPGLWEFTSENSMGGMINERMKQMEEQIAKMPKHAQERMRAMINERSQAQRETELSCITPAQAKKGVVEMFADRAREDPDCAPTVKWLGSGRGKITMRCKDGNNADGEIRVKSPTQIASTMTMKGPDGGAATMKWDGRWKGKDCGDVKPD